MASKADDTAQCVRCGMPHRLQIDGDLIDGRYVNDFAMVAIPGPVPGERNRDHSDTCRCATCNHARRLRANGVEEDRIASLIATADDDRVEDQDGRAWR